MIRSTQRNLALLAACVSFSAGAISMVHAGDPQIDQVRNIDNSKSPLSPQSSPALELTSGVTAPASPGDQDLGDQWLLKYKEKDHPFLLSADIAGFATNNVALTKNGTQRDQFLVMQVAAVYQPRLTENLSADFSFRQAFFQYNRFSVLDFESQTAGIGLTYLSPKLYNIAFFARYNYNRLLDGRQLDEIYTNHSFTLGFQKALVISRAHYFYAGYASLIGIVDPIAAQRDEHGAYAGYHVNLTRSLQADFFYRAALYSYTDDHRNDLNQTITGSLQYYFTQWLYAYASASLTLDSSNRGALDYNAFTSSVGLSANFKF